MRQIRELIYKRITDVNDALFPLCWNLNTNTFIEAERRTYEKQSLIIQDEFYHFEAIFSDDEFVGFTAYWLIDGNIFGEQLAIVEKYRNCGIGSACVKHTLSQGKTMTIEVELPGEEMHDRRIALYQRLGFVMNDFRHYQCKFRENEEFIELKVMSYPDKVDEDKFEEFYRRCGKYDILME